MTSHQALDGLLNDVVATIVGSPDARPRPGQHSLSHDILDAMLDAGGQVVGAAPTGLGKSVAYLAPAVLMAATQGQRTVISTESLALQAQIVDKDAPVIVAAARRQTGVAPAVAVLKGWGNYACFAADVEVLTLDGVRRIGDLAGQTATVLDGDGKWVEAPFSSFGVQEIVELELQRGTERRVIATTAEHRWFVQPNANYEAATETITTDLKPGDRLKYQGPWNRTLGKMVPSTFGIAHGIVFGDGSRFRSTDGGRHPGAAMVQLCGEKNWPLARYFNGAPQRMQDAPQGEHAEAALVIQGLPSYFKDIPSLDVNTGYLYGWLAGYFAADGSVSTDGCASISSATREHLEFVTAVCARLGIDHGTISARDRVGYGVDGQARTIYKLPLYADSLDPEFFLIDEHRARMEARRLTWKQVRTRRRWTVREVRRTGRFEEVFCAVVPTTASFTLAGNILTGNCARAAVATAQNIVGDAFSGGFLSEKGMLQLAHRVDEFVAVGATATGPLAALLGGAGATVEVDGREVPLEELAPLVSWALRVHTTDEPGDRHSFPGKVAEGAWGAVSVSPSECVGVGQCPFADLCKPAAAKRRAAEADIVVTNHSMLATQAANDLAVVVGSKVLGKFDHIVIDEAHALPSQVRSQGAKEVSGRRILSITKALRSVLDDHDSRVKTLLDDGSSVADEVDAELGAVLSRATPKDPVVKLVEGDDPVRATGAMLEQWLDRASAMLNGATSSARGDTEMKVRRVRGRIDNLKADLKGVVDHRVGVARWVDADTRGARPWPAAHSSPVEIGGMLHGNLWTAPVPDDEDAPEESEDLAIERIVGKDGRPRYELSVVAVSATLPGGFARDMGMRAQPGDYPSPFEEAYGASALYVPRATDPADVQALASPWSQPHRPKFDVKAHVQWVMPRLEALVDANGGSALILAATAEAGRAYAERLRAVARGRFEVLSQWDGNALRQTTAAWREDHHAVLVGTRSLMTGVDAPGDTCSLVVLDRIPRSPGNVVDDARVESLMKRLDTDKWAADRLVYSADAALLLEQAAGRLIRSMSDSGMVAVLDPRLLKVGPYKYQEQTRQVYMKALSRFDRKISDLGEAVAFLESRRAAKVAA